MSYQSSCKPTSRRAGPPAACSRSSASRPTKSPLSKADEAAQPDLERGVVLFGVHRVPGGRVIHLQEDEPGLEADDVQGQHPGGTDPVGRPGGHQRVPHGHRIAGGHPDLVPEVAGIARARHVDRHLADPSRTAPEVPEIRERRPGRRLEDVPRERALERERRGRLGLVDDRDIQSGAVLAEPSKLGIRGRPAIQALVEPVDRAVIDDLAVLVAPGRVVDRPDLELRRVPGDHAVDEPHRIRPRHEVLVERRHVEQRGGLTDGVVLDVVRVGVGARGEVARPLAPLHLAIEWGGPWMERRSDAHVG